MAWFLYKDSKPKYRKGICLRVRHALEDKELGPIIKKFTGALTYPDFIVVDGREDGIAYLHLWLRNFITSRNVNIGMRQADKKKRTAYVTQISKVVRIRIPENPEWVCESDIGRGLVGDK